MFLASMGCKVFHGNVSVSETGLSRFQATFSGSKVCLVGCGGLHGT